MEAALGERLQAVIVNETSSALEIVRKISHQKEEVELLIPSLNSAQKVKPRKPPKNSLGWASELVQTNKNLSPIVEALLQHTLIVEELEHALELQEALPGVDFVTLKGETLSSQGFLKSEVTTQGPSTLRLKNEINLLETQIAKKQEDLKRIEESVSTLSTQVEEEREKSEEKKQAIQEQTIHLNKRQAEHNSLEREKSSTEKKLKSLEQEFTSIQTRQKEASSSISTLDSAHKNSEKEKRKIEASLNSLSLKLEEASKAEFTHVDALSEIQTTVAVERQSYETLLEQQSPLTKRIAELRSSTSQRERELNSYKEKITTSITRDKQLNNLLGNNEAGVKQASQKLEEHKSQSTTLKSNIQSIESSLSEARKQLHSLTEKRGKEDIHYTKVELKIDNLTTTQREKHQIELSNFTPSEADLRTCLEGRNALAEAGIEWEQVEELALEATN